MASEQKSDQFNWGYLIGSDKSPAPLLEQLCLGIANHISTLEASTATDGLTPKKLAAFYRTVGGNYDTLFLSTPNSSLSFIYQSLGCFHTLQPTASAFEPPSIPALLPHGFVRWQTIQLLLCPEEHAEFLQNAVRHFDIANPSTGATFSKEIPRNAFPTEPDAEMVKWHETVSKRLELEYQARKDRERSPERPRHGPDARRSHSNSSSGKTQTEQDYFSQTHQRRSKNPSRPRTRAGTPSSEAYSPYTRPPPRRSDLTEDHPNLESDLDHGMPRYYHVDPADERRLPNNNKLNSPRSCSRHTCSRGRSRSPSRRRHHARDIVDVSQSEDEETGDEDGRESLTMSPLSRQRKHTSRSADGRLRSLHSRLLSPEPHGGRRHSHDSPFSNRNRSSSSRREQYAPSHSNHRIHVEIMSSDTEEEPDRDVRGRATRHQRQDEINDDDDDDYTPETRRARDFYHYHPYKSHSRGRPHHNPEYIVLPASASTSPFSSSTSSPSSSSSSPPAHQQQQQQQQQQQTPTPPPKFKEYILIDPDPGPPNPDSPSPAPANLYPRRPSASRTSSLYRQGGPVTINAAGASRAQTPAAPAAPPLSRRPSVKTISMGGGTRRTGYVPNATAGGRSHSGSGSGSGSGSNDRNQPRGRTRYG